MCAAATTPRDMCIETQIFSLPVPYREAWEMQKRRNEQVAQGIGSECIVAMQHPPVYTLGFHGDERNMKATAEQLAGIELIRIERGGDITFHGPGQLVVYPIINLRRRAIGVRRFVELIESCVMDFCSEHHIATHLRQDAPGVWCDSGGSDKKICAIGLKIRHGVSMHGLALNITTPLHYFQAINPCGFDSTQVTSMEQQAERTPCFADAASTLTHQLKQAIKDAST